MENHISEKYEKVITEYCVSCMSEDPIRIAQALMRKDPVRMHGPEHHYLVAAALLTAILNAQGRHEAIAEQLPKIYYRTKQIPPGVCGFYGVCGAVLGVGAAMSFLEKATPFSAQELRLVTEVTAEAQNRMMAFDGPRCCKRAVYVSLQAAVNVLARQKKICLPVSETIRCAYSHRNDTCKKGNCPYYHHALEKPDVRTGISPLALMDAFSTRPERYRMLDIGVPMTGWNGTEGELLEIGCSYGDGAAHMVQHYGLHVAGIDVQPTYIDAGREKHAALLSEGRLSLICADAKALPRQDKSVGGIVLEAAFSPMQGKEDALREYFRVLRPGGKVLMHDFCVQSGDEAQACRALAHIPCFAGINTMEQYQKAFEAAGFRTLVCQEDYGEMIRIVMWLCKTFGMKPKEVGGHLSGYYHSGSSRCRGAEGGCREEFHNQAHMSYCRLIFEKA